MIKTLFTIALIPLAIIGAGIIAADIYWLFRLGLDCSLIQIIIKRIKSRNQK